MLTADFCLALLTVMCTLWLKQLSRHRNLMQFVNLVWIWYSVCLYISCTDHSAHPYSMADTIAYMNSARKASAGSADPPPVSLAWLINSMQMWMLKVNRIFRTSRRLDVMKPVLIYRLALWYCKRNTVCILFTTHRMPMILLYWHLTF